MREDTRNQYHKSINKTIDFINAHLHEQISLEQLSEVSGISLYHFHRIFSAFIGEAPGSYIQRLRMETAAQALQTAKRSLAEIADITGYQNEQSLSRSFKKYFGVTPGAFRNIHNFFETTISSQKPAMQESKPDIRQINDKQLIYIRIIAAYGSNPDYDNAWMKLMTFAARHDILNGENQFIGLSFDDPSITLSNRCRFYACISTNRNLKPEGEFGTLKLSGGKYAVFTLFGPYSGLKALYNYIYFKWIPQNSYILRNSMPFEMYLNSPDEVKPEKLKTEIYIPIK